MVIRRDASFNTEWTYSPRLILYQCSKKPPGGGFALLSGRIRRECMKYMEVYAASEESYMLKEKGGGGVWNCSV